MTSHSDDRTRRAILTLAGGLLTALGTGGVASAADTESQSAEPLGSRPDIRGGSDIEPLGSRPDIRSLSVDPLGSRPDIRGGSDVEPLGSRPDIRFY